MTSLATGLVTTIMYNIEMLSKISQFLFTNAHFKTAKRTLIFSFKVWKAQCLLKKDRKGRVR